MLEGRQKLYKERFKLWGWQKNLPAKIARFMTEKAKKRKRETGSDTVFSYGGRQWTKDRAATTLTRAKRPRTDFEVLGKRRTQSIQRFLREPS
jgi:hypothetical protein